MVDQVRVFPKINIAKFKARKIKPKFSLLKIINWKRLLPIILLIAMFILLRPLRKSILFVLFVAVTAYITYYSKLYHIPIDISPLFFLQIVITRYYDIRYTLLFILLGYFGPKILAGHAANWMSYAFVSLSVFCNIISLFLMHMPLQTVGYITSVIQYIGGIFIVMTMMPIHFAIADGIANVTNNLMWFWIFSDFIVFLF